MPRRRFVLLVPAALTCVVVLIGLLFFVHSDDSSHAAATPRIMRSTPPVPDATSTNVLPTGVLPATILPTGVPTAGMVLLPAGGTAQLIPALVSEDGAMSVPDQLDQASWWGATLGAPRGATLLAGHVNWRGRTGPFAELWQDKVGQQITVVDNQGRDWVYRIAQLLTVAKADLPNQAKRLYGLDGDHRLVLATCGGEFVGGAEGYDDNRFAVATLLTRP